MKRLNWVLIALLCILSVDVSAQTSFLNKKISITVVDTAMDVVFDMLSKQTACYFSYSTNILSGNERISVNFNNQLLSVVLDSILPPNVKYREFKNQIIIYVAGTNLKQDPQMPVMQSAIKGLVIDSLTGMPLAFSNIAISGKYFGTISNELGEYVLRVPDTLQTEWFTVSSMGYHSRKLSFNELSINAKIALVPAVVSLQEVLVRSISAQILLNKARLKFNDNYQNNAYAYTAFYRESIRKDDKYLSYSEAMLKGLKFEINSIRDDRIVLIKSRKFKNIDRSDTLLVKLQGGIDASIQLDLVRRLPDFLMSESDENYSYKIHDLRVWDDKLVHVLSFEPKPGAVNAFFAGELYIGVNDMAILGAEFGYATALMAKVRKSLILRKSSQTKVKPISTNYYVKYTCWNGKYYLQHLRGEMNLKAKNRKQIRYSNYLTYLEMMVTSIDTINVSKPEKNQLLKTKSIFSESIDQSTDLFWESDNVILPESNILNAFKKSGFKLEEEQ